MSGFPTLSKTGCPFRAVSLDAANIKHVFVVITKYYFTLPSLSSNAYARRLAIGQWSADVVPGCYGPALGGRMDLLAPFQLDLISKVVVEALGLQELPPIQRHRHGKHETQARTISEWWLWLPLLTRSQDLLPLLEFHKSCIARYLQ